MKKTMNEKEIRTMYIDTFEEKIADCCRDMLYEAQKEICKHTPIDEEAVLVFQMYEHTDKLAEACMNILLDSVFRRSVHVDGKICFEDVRHMIKQRGLYDLICIDNLFEILEDTFFADGDYIQATDENIYDLARQIYKDGLGKKDPLKAREEIEDLATIICNECVQFTFAIN